MHIAILSPFHSPSSISYAEGVIEYLLSNQIKVSVEASLFSVLDNTEANEQLHIFEALDQSFDYLISIGGDGSMLQAITKVGHTDIPILGINTGRLGFLTSLQKESINQGLKQLFNKEYTLVERSLLEVHLSHKDESIADFRYALNEVSISRKNSASMISVHTKVNDQALATYWADGLIVATPTGSTGYSLSSGGPVMSPKTAAIVLTPIAPHNLNIRPLILPDDAKVSACVEGREEEHLLSLDSRIVSLPQNTKIHIEKAPFTIKTIQWEENAFFKTLQEKLYWGLDKRN